VKTGASAQLKPIVLPAQSLSTAISPPGSASQLAAEEPFKLIVRTKD